MLRGHVDRAGFGCVAGGAIFGGTLLAIVCLTSSFFRILLLMVILSLRRFGQITTFLVAFDLMLLLFRLGKYLLNSIICRICC